MKQTAKRLCLILFSLVMMAAVLGCSKTTVRDWGGDFFDPEDDRSSKWGDIGQDTTPTPLPTLSPTPLPTPEPAESDSENWTIMIYMNGTDLESLGGEATANLSSLLSVVLPGTVNVILYTGGTLEWQNEIIDSAHNQIYLVEDQQLVLLESFEKRNMGETDTLADFITYAQTNYPADKKALLFWNHGAGSIGGVCVDEYFNYDGLVLTEMADAFEASFDGQKFNLIGYDACLMATVEMASVLEPYAKYMVASEEIEPGGGWNYEYWCGALADNPAMTGEALGIAITDGYYQKYLNTENEGIVTCSVVDLSQIPVLEEMLGEYAERLNSDIDAPEAMNRIARSRQHTLSYGEMPGTVPPDMVDLYDFVDLQKDTSPQLAADLMRAIEDAVVYEVKGSQQMYSYGLAIYFPCSAKEYFGDNLYIYNQIDFCPEYKQFVNAFAAKLTDQTYLADIPEYDEELVEETGTASDGDFSEVGSYYVTLSGEEFEYMCYVYCTVGMYLEDGVLVDLGYDSDLVIDYDTGTIHDNFGGWWTGLNGKPVAVYVMEETDDYVIYNIPVLYNGEMAVVTGSWVWNDAYDEGGYYTFNGIFYTIDEYAAPSTKMSIELEIGDEITPLYKALYSEDGYEGYYTGEPFLVGNGGLCLELIWLPDGLYKYGFLFIDNYGNEHHSEFIEFELY